jgi:hypothetical protein
VSWAEQKERGAGASSAFNCSCARGHAVSVTTTIHARLRSTRRRKGGGDRYQTPKRNDKPQPAARGIYTKCSGEGRVLARFSSTVRYALRRAWRAWRVPLDHAIVNSGR